MHLKNQFINYERPELRQAINQFRADLPTVVGTLRSTIDNQTNKKFLADNDFDDLLPLANKETKLAKSQKEERAVFKLFSLGVVTARDDWVYDFNEQNLIENHRGEI